MFQRKLIKSILSSDLTSIQWIYDHINLQTKDITLNLTTLMLKLFDTHLKIMDFDKLTTMIGLYVGLLGI